jgi:hypothetical protein
MLEKSRIRRGMYKPGSLLNSMTKYPHLDYDFLIKVPQGANQIGMFFAAEATRQFGCGEK